MTASASASKTLSANYGTYTLSVSWSESNPNVTTNKSKITASATLSSSNTAFASNYNQHISVYWFDNNQYPNGIKIAGTDFKSCGMSPYTSQSASGSIEVPHKDDGTLSGYCLTYFTNNNGGPYAPASNSCSTSTKSLDTIARASIPSASPNPITLSAATNTLTVATNRKASSFTHTVTCAIGSYTDTQNDVGESTTFSIPDSILADFDATATTLTGTLTCVTYNGATNIGTKTASLTAQIDTTQEHPAVTSVTLTDTNANSAAIESPGTFIKWASDLSASIVLGVVGSYTELASATVVCGNTSQTYALSGTSQTITFTYSKLDNDSLTVYVTDERGTTVSHTETWTLIPYRDLTVTGSVDRTSETGNQISFTLEGACFAGSFGLQTNTITVSYKYKLRSDPTYTTGGSTWTFTPTGDGETTFNYTNTISGFDYDKQYDIIFTVTDLFTTADTRELQLTTGIPVYGNGEDFFAVYGDLFVHDRTDPTDYINVRSLVEQNASDIVSLFARVKQDTDGIWTRLQIGNVLILLCTNSVGGQLNFGVTFDSVPFVLSGPAQDNYGHGNANMQIWSISTTSLNFDAYYGSTTKYPVSLMVIGLYSGQI